MEIEGRVPWSSNYTFLVSLHLGEDSELAVYKPSRGERPLWDFAANTLCRREVASYLLSRELGWPNIPAVVLRRGPYGPGSVQRYVEIDPEEHFFTLREDPANRSALRQIVLFDALANNADRKGGHVLKGRGGTVWAIDHGLTFHAEHKLRTVIWDYAGEPIEPDWLEQLRLLGGRLADGESAVGRSLQRLIAPEEVGALALRLGALIASGTYPLPQHNWRNVPYPLV